MAGGKGDDDYAVDHSADEISEQADSGYERVYTTISYTLSAHIEYLQLLDTAIEGIGNEQNNHIVGNALDNSLYGLGGDDNLFGDFGHNKLFGWIDYQMFESGY